MLLMVKKNKGGICHAIHRYVKAIREHTKKL